VILKQGDAMLFEPDEREIRKKKYISGIRSRKIEGLIAPLRKKLQKLDKGEIEPEELFRTAGYVAREGERITGDFKKRTDVILAGIAMDENLCMSTVGDIGVSVRRGKVTGAFSDVIVIPLSGDRKMESGPAAEVREEGGAGIERELAEGEEEEEIVVTSAGDLHCRNIIHVDCRGESGFSAESTGRAVSAALQKAEELEAATVALSEMAPPSGDVPAEQIAEAVVDALRSHSGEEVSRVVIVCSSEEAAGIFVDLLDLHE
jgi:O-acetyl-ADP-ribose deacetylase (regulator of RNase III)